jgi:hypothetical protein
LLTCSLPAIGQDSLATTPLSEIRKNNFQVELGTNNFSSLWSGSVNGTLLFKRKINFGKFVEVSSLKMLRAYFSLNTQINFTDDPSLNPKDTARVYYHPSDEYNFTLGLGFEKQTKGKFFVHYFGLDLFNQFYRTNDDIFNGEFGGVTVNQTGTTDRYIQTMRLGITPFAGLKYYLTNQLSLGIETGMQLFWFHTKFTEVGFEVRLNGNTQEVVFVEHKPVLSNGIILKYSGVRFVTLGYTF